MTDLLEHLEHHLGPDLAFLAPRLAPALERAIQVGVRAGLQPYEESAQQQRREAYQGKLDAARAKMDKKYPGWEQHDQTMLNAYKWLISGELEHPEFGDKHELLYQLVKSKLAPEQPSRPANIEKQVASAQTNDAAFEIAVEAAMRELGMADSET